MNDLSTLQKRAQTARQNLAQAEDALHDARNRLQSKQQQLQTARRRGKAGENDVARLEREIKSLQATIAERETTFTSRTNELAGILTEFSPLAEPQKLIEQLDDHLPILLLPVRIETRFMVVDDRDELWVRIFPDELAVHTHETTLTADELADGKTYWRERWQAAQTADDDERANLEKGAWRALAEKHGGERAAWIARETEPATLDVSEPDDLQFPKIDEEALKPDSWSRAPRTKVMPDRFVVMAINDGETVHEIAGKLIPDPLYLGPDPSQAEADLAQQNGDLHLSERLRWLHDFEQAVAVGMGVRIPLTSAQSRDGFDRIMVLGLRLSANAEESQQLVEELIDNHHYAPEGMSFLPQGTPTNNTDRTGAGFSSVDPGAEESFVVETGPPNFEITNDPQNKADAQLFAERLGIAHQPLQFLQNAGQQDLIEARAMNKSLWPATLGYFLSEMLELGDKSVRQTREFFVDHVTGRGPLPAMRIGDQPYGVLPVTSFAHWQWSEELERGRTEFLDDIFNILLRLDQQWSDLVANVARVDNGAGSFQNLLDILSLHASSVEYFRRRAVGREYFWNYHQFSFSNAIARLIQELLNQRAQEILTELGFEFETPPQIFDLAFFFDHDRIDDPLIADVENREKEKLSESAGLKTKYKVGELAELQNYIGWLIHSDFDKIKSQEFVDGDDASLPVPKPLLYRMLKRGLLLTYYEATERLLVNHDVLTAAAFREVELPNVREERDVTRWEFMEAPVSNVLPDVSDSTLPIVQYLLSPEGQSLPEALTVTDVRDCLQRLQSLPTARLERLFAEHVDLCTYRLDSWFTGIISNRLQALRYPVASEGQFESRTTGLHLGAFGWLENLRPAPRPEPVNLEDVPEALREPDKGPITEQPDNGGFIHGPSINHAVAAAVLRNGYLTHADPGRPSLMSVNLSSERVRTALAMLKGVRNGQELGALLGYQFERGLQERHGDPSLAQFILNFRQKYPLVADKITPDADDDSVEVKEASNVLDGYALLEAAFLKDSPVDYPYGVSGLPAESSTAGGAINDEVERLFETFDAIADLALAEGVYQVTQGNYDRAGAMLKAVNEGGHPPEPEIVNTPRSGAAVNHRVAVHFDSRDSVASPWPGDATPRAEFENGVNKWLGDQLGAPEQIKFIIEYTVGETTTQHTLSADDLQIHPIDFILLIPDDFADAATELETRIAHAFRAKMLASDPAFDASGTVAIRFMARDGFGPEDKSLFEMLPLARQLRDLITSCRPLAANDYQLPSEQTTDPEVDPNPGGIDFDEAQTRVDGTIMTFETAIDELLAAIPPEALDDDPATVPDLTAIDFAALRVRMIVLANFGLADAFPRAAFGGTDGAKSALVQQAVLSARTAEQRLEQAKELRNFRGLDAAELTLAEKITFLRDAAKQVFGDAFNMLPKFAFKNTAEVDAATAFRDEAPDKNLTRFSNNPLIVDEWLQGVSKVRDKMQSLAAVRSYREMFAQEELALKPLQLPFRETDHWIAMAFPEVSEEDLDNPEVFKPEGEFLSVVQQLPEDYASSHPQTGLVIDEWAEVIPNRIETTGIAVHYNQPNTEPPQSILLAVSPHVTGSWQWAHLVDTLQETFDLAKKRGVEPDQLAKTPFGQLLPAILTAVTSYPFATIATDLVYATRAE